MSKRSWRRVSAIVTRERATHAGRLLNFRDLGEALEIGVVEALREQCRVMVRAGCLERGAVLLGEGAVGRRLRDAVVMGLERQPGGSPDMRRVPVHDLENRGIDLERPQPGF